MRIKTKKLFETTNPERKDLRRHNATRVASYSVKHGRKYTGIGFDIFELDNGELKLFVPDEYLLH